MSARVDLLDLMDLPERADMNDALRDWAADAQDPPVPGAAGPKAHTDAPCGICAKPARDACLRCDRPACPAHRGVMTGLCDRCTDEPAEPAHRVAPAGEAAGRFDDEVPAAYPDLGISWIE